MYFELVRKMPKRQSSRTGSDSGRGRGPGPSSSGSRGPAEFPEGDNEGDDPFQQAEGKQGGNNLGVYIKINWKTLDIEWSYELKNLK